MVGRLTSHETSVGDDYPEPLQQVGRFITGTKSGYFEQDLSSQLCL